MNTIVSLIQEADVLPYSENNWGLHNEKFTDKVANAVQQHDLLNFRLVGQEEYLKRVSVVMLKNPSVHAPNRKRRLQILSDKKVSKSRVTQLERDKRFVITAMKKKMKFSQRTGKPVDRPGEQLIELPLEYRQSRKVTLHSLYNVATKTQWLQHFNLVYHGGLSAVE